MSEGTREAYTKYDEAEENQTY